MTTRLALTSLALLLTGWATGHAQELRPGVWAGGDLGTLPLPASGYQVYLMGELHGVRETEALLSRYLELLHAKTGLRDVAFEEDAVYQRGAEDYVEGRSSVVPEPLCLRAVFLEAIRRFNEGRRRDDLVRVHLVDIDTPATAIRQHLLAIKEQLPGAVTVRIPDVKGIKKRGLKAVDDLRKLTDSPRLLAELRTVRYSVLAHQQGLEVGTRGFKGSPYLDDREDAISSNIRDLLREPDCRGVLALYGSDHVSKARRKDGGPKRDRSFSPLALRLKESGVSVLSVVVFPLSGRMSWRGYAGELPYTARDGSLADRDTLDRVLAAAPGATVLYVDPKRQKIRLPSQDITAYVVDAFLLPASATAMEDRCAAP
jgi:hypothetical protein